MEYRLACLHRLALCLLLLSLQGMSGAFGSQLTCSYNPSSPVTLGTVNSTLTCAYAPDSSGETLTRMEMSVKRPSSTSTLIFTVTFFNPTVVGYPSNDIALEYKNRTNISANNSRTDVTIHEILCKDEVEFSATLDSLVNSIERKTSANVNLTVQAPALPPQVLTSNPSGTVTEYTTVTFTCTANVGARPRGTIRWEVYENNVPTARDVTSQSSISSQGPDPTASCTEVQTSVLPLNLTRRENEAVVRCVVERQGQQPPSVHNQTARLDVLYGVRDSDVVVGARPPRDSFVVGDPVTLVCSATANPDPSFSWTRAGSNWTQAGKEVTLNSVKLEDAGKYVCEASNNVSGTVHTASNAYQLRVTEVPPTTTPTPSSSSTQPSPGPTGGSTGTTSPPAAANIGLIVGLVVGCLVLVVVVVLIIVFCRKRNKNKEIEEPSEKPYNNRQNINSISTQPDLVNDKQYSPYKNDDLSPYIDDKPRSRRPVDFGSADYNQTYMPQV